jgi:hypothetical protein
MVLFTETSGYKKRKPSDFTAAVDRKIFKKRQSRILLNMPDFQLKLFLFFNNWI